MNNLEDKKSQFVEQKSKSNRGKLIGIVAVVVIGVCAGVGFFMTQSSSAGPYLKASNGSVLIPLAEISDGTAHYFAFESTKGPVKFFTLKSPDGNIRAAFDACDVCYRSNKGYRQEGNFMVCNNCNQKFESTKINEIKGGCNPAPLKRVVAGDNLVIAATDLASGAWYFNHDPGKK